MSIIEKIRTEIERRKLDGLEHGLTFVPTAMQSLLEYLDTLQKQPVCEDVEEAARVYSETTPFKFPNQVPAGKQGFIAGANWQKGRDNIKATRIARKAIDAYKEQMMKEGLDAVKSGQFNKIEKTIAGVFVKYGMDRQREILMKEAVEARVCSGMEGDKWIMTYVGDYESMIKLCKAGDKVRIIIIKED